MEHSILLENGKYFDDDKGRQDIVRFAVIITYISSRCFSGSTPLKHKVIYFHLVSMKVSHNKISCAFLCESFHSLDNYISSIPVIISVADSKYGSKWR